MERHSFARIFMNIYLKVQYVLPNEITYETKNDLISIYITKPSSAYTDLTHFTVWLNQISLSQIKEHETRFGWKFCERCSRSYQAVVLHSRLMGITVRTNLGFPVENRHELRSQKESTFRFSGDFVGVTLEFIFIQQMNHCITNLPKSKNLN